MLTLKPGGFIETQDNSINSCNGPRYIRGQNNRETGGVTMQEVENKYVPEFEIPYRNVERYIKEITQNWDKLDQNQRSQLQKSFKQMNMPTMEKFKANGPGSVVGSQNGTGPGSTVRENFGAGETNLSCATYLAQNPKVRIPELLSTLWKPTEVQRNSIVDNSSQEEGLIEDMKSAVHSWITDQDYSLICNWKSGLLVFLIILVAVLLSSLGYFVN